MTEELSDADCHNRYIQFVSYGTATSRLLTLFAAFGSTWPHGIVDV